MTPSPDPRQDAGDQRADVLPAALSGFDMARLMRLRDVLDRAIIFAERVGDPQVSFSVTVDDEGAVLTTTVAVDLPAGDAA